MASKKELLKIATKKLKRIEELNAQSTPKAKNLVIYLSGPMTGLPDWNFPEFNRVAKKLRALGAVVLNPAETDGGNNTSHPRKYYMRFDIELLLKANSIVVLDGWQKSRGAKVETDIAKELDLPFFDEDLNPYNEETICQEADRIVSSDRGSDYGHPIHDFTRTGILWQGVLRDWAKATGGDEPVPPNLVGLCMVGVKMSREVNKSKRDNRVDGAGYFKCVDMIANYKD